MAKVLINLQDVHTSGYHGVHMIHEHRRLTAEPMEDIFYDEFELYKESSNGDEYPLVYMATITATHKPSMQVVLDKLAQIKQQSADQESFSSDWAEAHSFVVMALTNDQEFVDKVSGLVNRSEELDTYILLEVTNDQITGYNEVE
jgi:hypothetical protein